MSRRRLSDRRLLELEEQARQLGAEIILDLIVEVRHHRRRACAATLTTRRAHAAGTGAT